jgi:hypothetical protein
MTALVEHESGEWEILTYPEFRRRLLARAAERSMRRNGRRLAVEPTTISKELPALATG